MGSLAAGTPSDAASDAHMVKVHEAKARLSALLREVEGGGEVTIARGSTPIAKLVPVDDAGAERPRRPMGFLHYRMPDSFFDELPSEELAAWEGSA